MTGTDCINTNGGVDAFIPAPYTDGSIISASAETPPPTSLFPQACNQRTIVVKLLFACFRLMSEILQHVFQLMQAGKAVLKHFFWLLCASTAFLYWLR
ncbi:hypothetical protein FGV07_23440 [Salmonella enterica]|nr:hypothetical protein [Salmonella enterica]EJC4633715.1 hypothetical protein [Salmonella enterica]EJU5648229.1 hypothetical protein [Salmonella enterica]ELU4020616.1 hypothetical protein [Salmonella enterica]